MSIVSKASNYRKRKIAKKLKKNPRVKEAIRDIKDAQILNREMRKNVVRGIPTTYMQRVDRYSVARRARAVVREEKRKEILRMNKEFRRTALFITLPFIELFSVIKGGK